MSDTSAFGFGQFVPGFDFLQNLSKTAAQAAPAAGAVPGVASWVAPTLSIEEIDKRIQELKAVQFWLDQNATALKATIQAMEVQKMTLSTLQSMNVNMADLAKAFTAKPPTTKAEDDAVSAAAPAASQSAKTAVKTSIFSPKPEPAPEAASAPQTSHEQNAAPQVEAKADTTAQAASDKPAVDPMQWWGALTQQFQGIAAAALKDVAGEAMKAGMAAQAAATAEPSNRAKRPSPSKAASKATVKAPSRAKTPAAKKSAAASKNPAAVKSAAQPVAKAVPRSAARKRATP